MSFVVPLSLAAVLALALAACLVALRRVDARAADAEARRDALAERTRAARAALRALQAMPILDVPSVSAETSGEPPVVLSPDSVRRSRTDGSDARRGLRRTPRLSRPVSDPSPPARP